MEMQLIENETQEIFQFLSDRIKEFNVLRWDVTEKKPLAVVFRNEDNRILGGGSARTFGKWLMIENIWIDESMRGQKLGTQILNGLETEAKSRGCEFAHLDTLEFQARPFYEKHGYKVVWGQDNYPTQGHRYYMVKKL